MVENIIFHQKRPSSSPLPTVPTAPERSFHRALRSVASDAEASPAWHCAAGETPRPGFGPGSPGFPGSATWKVYRQSRGNPYNEYIYNI